MHDGPDAARMEPGPRPSAVAARQWVPILLAAAAVFLTVLILARSPLQGFVVCQRVQAVADRTTTVAPLATKQVATWIKADAVLASVVQQVCSRDSLAAQNDLVQELHRGLQIQPQSNIAAQAGWQLSLQHHDRQLASQLLMKLSGSLTSQLKLLDQAEAQLLVQHYQKALAQAREEEDIARVAIERVRHDQMNVAMQTPKTNAAVHGTGNRTEDLSPAWQDLQQKIAVAKARLAQLLTNRTAQHPQVIEAQNQLSQLQEQLDHTPRQQSGDATQEGEPTPSLRGPQLPEAARAGGFNKPRVTVRLISSSDETLAVDPRSLSGQIQQLSAQWSAATARRSAIERSWSEAQQQWVRGLNAEGWTTSASWTQSQQGGQSTPFQLLLAGVLATCAGLGTWRLTQLARRGGALSTLTQLSETLPLPVLGQVPLTTTFPLRLPEQMSTHVLRLTQLSLATLAAVLLVCAWASTADPNLSAAWSSDPVSAVGQAFDLLQQRIVG